jgi:phage shock protein A
MESALQDFIAARAASAAPSATNASPGSTQGKVDRAGSAFDRVLTRQTGIAGATAAVNADAAKLRELQDLARTHRIDERLAALKAAQGTR